MIPLRQLSKTPFSIIPYKSSNVVKQRLNEVSLCKKLTSMMLNSKLVKSNSRISSKSSVLLSNAFELLLSLPFKRLKKREDSVFRVSAALKSDFGVVRDLDVGTRRAIAIQRVLEDKYDGNSVRDYFLFPTSRGDQLFIQSWTPVSVDTKGLVVLLHGLNEHSGRYNNFAKQLNANGYKVYGMDWIGISFLLFILPCTSIVLLLLGFLMNLTNDEEMVSTCQLLEVNARFLTLFWFRLFLSINGLHYSLLA
ncbi:hypothetical protein AQUCO_00201235v1 [Aquilegia coerulea]|uniref:Serine aminopeptidase S33 domain-containing protein n=1 Tax=Aquilegia coerulea TaxID=218851 RepID=A0A2G5F6W3_AQUCA|nr:hypothetical protein AQUCO_00201235v1 [Aquilegia coerulea]